MEAPHRAELGECWLKVRSQIEALWEELSVPESEAERCRSEWFSHGATAQSYYNMLQYAKEALLYRKATLQIMEQILERERLFEDLTHTYAICVSDPRLGELDYQLKALDELGVRIVKRIFRWARRFARFTLDMDRAERTLPQEGSDGRPKAWPVFVWGRRDYLERIRTNVQELHFQGRSGGASSPLVGQAMRQAGFACEHPLYDGPSPDWYEEGVRDVGVRMLTSNPKLGQGELRYKIHRIPNRRARAAEGSFQRPQVAQRGLKGDVMKDMRALGLRS